MNRRLAFGCLVLIPPLLAGIAGCGSSSNSSRSSASTSPAIPTLITPGTITAVSLEDGAPFSSIDTSGEWTGYEVALVQKIALDLHMKLTINGMEDFTTILPSIEGGLDDIAFASIGDTNARRQSIDYTLPDYTGYNNLVVLNTSQIPTLSQEQIAITEPVSATGARVGVMQSTLEAAYAQEYFTGATIVTFPSNIAAILALMSGSVDSIYIDGQDAYTYQTQYSVHTAFRGDSPTDIGAGIVVNKNDTQLREAMNADLRKLLANGTIATLLAAYDPHESTATITGFLETYYKENPSNSYGSGQVALPSP